MDSVLSVLGLLAWGLWAYLVFAILLNVLAALAAAGGKPWRHTLASASELLTPWAIRRLVEWTVGGVFLITTVSGHVQASRPIDPAVIAAPDQPVGAYAVETAAKEASKKVTYRVRAGDSLWRIGEHELGSGFRWRKIFELNRGRRFRDGRSLTNPHLIYPEWQLQLSRMDNEVADASQNKPHANAPSSTAASSEPIIPIPFEKPRVIPMPENGAAEEPAGGEVSDRHEAEQPEAERPMKPLIRLPSGLVVAASFASGLLTAHLLSRLRERRSRRLSVPDADEIRAPRLDVDLRRAGASPMPPPLDVALDTLAKVWMRGDRLWPRIVMVVERQRNVEVLLRAQNSALPSDAGGGVSPLVRFSRDRTFVRAEVSGPFPSVLRPPLTSMQRGLTIPLGRGPDDSAIHLAMLATGPVSISGPKAADLVRQMVIALAAQGPPEDLQMILLGIPADLQHIDWLPHVTGSYPWDKAAVPIREVQAELLRRARLFLEEGVEDIWAHLAHHPDDRLPGLLLVVGDPPAPLRGSAEGVAQQASSLGVALLGIGWEPAGSRLSAELRTDTDLRTNLPGFEQLQPLLLGQGDAEEAIEIIQRAYPSQEQDTEPLTGPVAEERLLSITTPKDSIPLHISSRRNDELPAREDLRQPSPPPGVVAVRCLGPFQISRSGRPIRKGWRSKSLELAAFLVAHPGGASKDRIVEELWPEIDPHQGSELFYVATSNLRGKLRSANDSGSYVDREGEVFRLEEGKWWVDAWEFEGLLEGSNRLDEAGHASGKLRDAISLYQGEFCSERYYPWAEGIRERLRALFVRACAQLADRLSEVGRYENALSILERGIEADSVCEDLCRRAMAIEGRLGRRAAALTRYRKLEAKLDAELGVEPDPETQALTAQLEAGSKAG